MNPKLVYIAGPYRAPTRWGVEKNIHAAENLAIGVATLGAFPVCPHANARQYFGDVQTPEFWLTGTLKLLEKCDAVIFVSGWKQSEGATNEYKRAQEIGMPTFLHLRELEEWLSNFKEEEYGN